jgi:hypothetical protein
VVGGSLKKPVKYVGNQIALSVPISNRVDGPELAIRGLLRHDSLRDMLSRATQTVALTRWPADRHRQHAPE